MKKNQMLISVLAVLLLCFGAFVGVIVAHKSPILGLDLRGGDDYLYCPTNVHTGKCAAPGTVSSAKLNEVVQILQDRVGALGVAQPNISVQGGDVDVQVPGHVNDKQLVNIIGHTSNLYFRKVLCVLEPWAAPTKSTTTTSTSSTTTTTVKAKVSAKGSTTTTTSASSSSTTSTTSKSTTTTTKPSKSTTTTKPTTTTSTTSTTSTTTTTTQPPHYNVGYTPPPACPSTFTSTSAIQAGDAYTIPDTYQASNQGVNTSAQDLGNPTQNMVLPFVQPGETASSPERLMVGPIQASAAIISGASSQVGTSGPVVTFNFKGGGLAVWNAKVAAPDYQAMISDDLSGQIVTMAENQSQTYSSSGVQITGLTGTEVSQITLLLQYGALPVNIIPIDQSSVSPTLGAASLHAGVIAGLVGLLLVMGYTIWYYRALGIVVVIGLVSTGALIYAIISAARLTLDLSGVTGLIVSIGITVDSYIVYFERLKDEVRAGRSVRSSVDKGFKSAFRTIVSADLVSLIGAVVLYFLSIGNVKNFAFMLGISTILDLGSAYFFTRPLVILLGRNRLFTEARGLGIARGLAAPITAEAGA
jgi:preprotein translocase subunit SecD